MKLSTPTINKATLDAADIGSLQPEARLEQAIISGDGVGLRAPNISIEESVFERALLIEAKLEKLGLRDVELKACDFSAAHCSESSLVRVHFNGGRMTGVDFSRSTLQDVVFEDCRLEKVEFGQSKIKQVDARTSQLYDIRGWQSLRGLIVDSTQLVVIAPQLANELGIVIKED